MWTTPCRNGKHAAKTLLTKLDDWSTVTQLRALMVSGGSRPPVFIPGGTPVLARWSSAQAMRPPRSLPLRHRRRSCWR